MSYNANWQMHLHVSVADRFDAGYNKKVHERARRDGNTVAQEVMRRIRSFDGFEDLAADPEWPSSY